MAVRQRLCRSYLPPDQMGRWLGPHPSAHERNRDGEARPCLSGRDFAAATFPRSDVQMAGTSVVLAEEVYLPFRMRWRLLPGGAAMVVWQRTHPRACGQGRFSRRV
jgi:hypothetical protein